MRAHLFNAGRKERDRQELEQMGQGDMLPVYQIYMNNCDHVARLLASSVDSELQDYSVSSAVIVPMLNLPTPLFPRRLSVSDRCIPL